MSLKPVESLSVNTYMKTGNLSGLNYHTFYSCPGVPPSYNPVYIDWNDTILAPSQEAVGGGTVYSGLIQVDPLFLDNSSPIAKFVETGAPAVAGLGVGEWDREAGTQRIYGNPGPTPYEIYEIDQHTLEMQVTGSSYYPFNWFNSNVGIGTVGGWDNGPTAEMNAETIFFETWGYALRPARCHHTDGNLYRGLVLVDLADGKGTLLDVAVHFSATPAAYFEQFTYQADNFVLARIQFAPDDDSVPAAPKGRIFLSSWKTLSDAGNVPSADLRQWMKIIEWNPLGVSPAPGNSNRVHLRQIVFTRLNFIEREAWGTNPNSMGDRTATIGRYASRFHPPSRTFVTIGDTGSSSVEGSKGYVRTSLVPGLSQIENPTNLQEVETAKTIRFQAQARGDVGEPVGGLPATWSLERRSSYDEALDTVGLPATSTVANPPIDTGSLVVKLNGTPLTLTTDYTVVESTGVITWAGAHPTAETGYTADYRHSNTGATPAHGTLLQASSRTNELGIAETEVQYADDDEIADHASRDRITVEMTDD